MSHFFTSEIPRNVQSKVCVQGHWAETNFHDLFPKMDHLETPHAYDWRLGVVSTCIPDRAWACELVPYPLVKRSRLLSLWVFCSNFNNLVHFQHGASSLSRPLWEATSILLKEHDCGETTGEGHNCSHCWGLAFSYPLWRSAAELLSATRVCWLYTISVFRSGQ